MHEINLDGPPARPSQTTLESTIRRPCTEKRKGDLTAAVVYVVAVDMKPINTVEGKGFKHLMKVAEPDYHLPKREYVSSELTRKHKCIKKQVRSEIDQCAAVAFTTDIWTSIKMEA